MTHKSLSSRHALESCTYQLHSWKPFQLQTLSKALEPDLCNSKYYSVNSTTANGVLNKRPCLSDRTTTFSIDNFDLSRLSLFDDEKNSISSHNRGKFRCMARKRRRRGSRSVSGRSSDRSGTRRCCSVGASAAYATCSDFPVAVGTDSSGEFFVSGDPNWSSDVSEAKNSRRDSGVGGEKENLGSGTWQVGAIEFQGNESGYGSEPGYRGDGELGYGDEFDEEEDEGRVLFWGEQLECRTLVRWQVPRPKSGKSRVRDLRAASPIKLGIQIVRWRWLGRTIFLSKRLITDAGARSMTGDDFFKVDDELLSQEC